MLIAVALILLVCSFKKQSSSSSSNSGSDENASEKPAIILKVVDPEPKIVVIMAGDETPSFLAMPAVSSTICRCDHQLQLLSYRCRCDTHSATHSVGFLEHDRCSYRCRFPRRKAQRLPNGMGPMSLPLWKSTAQATAV
ncbi:hypothetical protein Dsin_016909 [Dipteronia sinensis]|uniref:Secreted protein n=1 Tax=Dipteronia sinensis TaxID=43782 RepID=A0AAE0AEY0_9ROSI|nr:hypothetical protein Dsin_016909 [Dipteronia sinensis]